MQKNVLITGVSSGIGQALAKRWLDMGATVFGLSRRSSAMLDSVPLFHQLSVDITDVQACVKVLADLLKGVKQLDIVVLNAGALGTVPKDLQACTLEELKGTMEVNLWANKTVLDYLLENINIAQVVSLSSGAAVNGNRGWNGYALSKAALNMLMQLYASECQETHFCALAPGLVDTAMQDVICAHKDDLRYESIKRIKACRSSEKMPTANKLAPRLVDVISSLPKMVDSGSFADLRSL